MADCESFGFLVEWYDSQAGRSAFTLQGVLARELRYVDSRVPSLHIHVYARVLGRISGGPHA